MCKQVIERHLLRPLADLFSPELVAGYTDPDLVRIAAESPQTSANRKSLYQLRDDLVESLAELDR